MRRAPHNRPEAEAALAPAVDLRHQLSVGAVWTATGLAAAAVSSFCLTVVLARAMTPADYGFLSTAIAGTGLASVVAGAGLNQAIAHVGAVQHQHSGHRGVIATATAGLSIAVRIAALVCAIALTGFAIQRAFVPGQSSLAAVLLALTPLVAIFPVAAVLNGTMLAAYRPRAFAIGNVIIASATLAIVAFLLSVHRRSPVDVAVAKSVAAVAGLTFLGFYFWHSVARANGQPAAATQRAGTSTPPRDLRRQLLRTAPAMVLISAFAAAISQLDVLLTGTLRGPRAAASYQPTSRVLDLISFLLACFAPFFLALASRAAARGDVGAVGALQHWTSRWALALGAPVMAPLLIAPAATLHSLYGAGYQAPTVAARLLGVAGVVACAVGFAAYSLAAMGEARLVGRMLAGFLVIDFTACLALIPVFGITGAAMATSGCLVVSLLLCALVLWRRFRVVPWNRSWLVTAGAFATSLLVAAALPWSSGAEFGHAAAVAVIAGVLTIGASFFSSAPSERRWILQVFTQPIGLLRRPSSSG